MVAFLIAQVTDVHCTNCGADWWTKVAAVATLVGLLIAVAAFVVSSNAANAANESLKLTRDQFDIAKDEHAQFLRELRAHAELTVEFYPGGQPDAAGYIRSEGPFANLQAKLTIRNVGDRGSGRTQVEVFVPVFVDDMLFGWQDESGNPLDRPWSMQSRGVADVILDDGEGHSFAARRLPRELGDVPPRLPAELPISFPVPLEPQGLAVPYRIRVSAENMSQSVEVDGVFRVAPPDTSRGVAPEA